MTERPILFSGPMVRAILEGRKTQTRRVVKPGPPPCQTSADAMYIYRHGWRYSGVDYACERDLEVCPHGIPGNRLWVRETLRPSQSRVVTYAEDGCPAWHDGESVAWPWPNTPAVRTAIFMPRWACRITLEITDVRVARVRGISEEDAISEGIAPYQAPPSDHPGDPRHNFGNIWDSINAKRGFGWAANPWVWALTFKRVSA